MFDSLSLTCSFATVAITDADAIFARTASDAIQQKGGAMHVPIEYILMHFFAFKRNNCLGLQIDRGHFVITLLQHPATRMQ